MENEIYNLELKLINEAVSIIDEEKEKKENGNLHECKEVILGVFKSSGFNTLDVNEIKYENIKIAVGIVELLAENGLDSTKRSLDILKSHIATKAIDYEMEKLEKPGLNYPYWIFILMILIDCVLVMSGIWFYRDSFNDFSNELKLYIYIFLIIMTIILFVVGLFGMYSVLKDFRGKYKNESDYYYNKLNYLENKKREFYGFN